jgi:predicted phosphodiesterase
MQVVMGDVHGDFTKVYRTIQHLEPNDTLILAGDVGVGFVTLDQLERLGGFAEEEGVELLAIRGNHDYPKFFQEGRTFNNLELIPDYTVRKIGGRNILFIGGAISIDRIYRESDISYWRDEHIICDLSLLPDEKIDVVISHSCPNKPTPAPKCFKNIQGFLDKDKHLRTDLEEERAYLDEVWTKVKPKKWFYGHFHVSKLETLDGTDFRCMNINEAVQF